MAWIVEPFSEVGGRDRGPVERRTAGGLLPGLGTGDVRRAAPSSEGVRLRGRGGAARGAAGPHQEEQSLR